MHWSGSMPAAKQHPVHAGQTSHACKALQKYHALPDKQNKRERAKKGFNSKWDGSTLSLLWKYIIFGQGDRSHQMYFN